MSGSPTRAARGGGGGGSASPTRRALAASNRHNDDDYANGGGGGDTPGGRNGGGNSVVAAHSNPTKYLDPILGPRGRRALPSVRIGDHVLVRLCNAKFEVSQLRWKKRPRSPLLDNLMA